MMNIIELCKKKYMILCKEKNFDLEIVEMPCI